MGSSTKTARQKPSTALQHSALYLTQKQRPQYGLNLQVLIDRTPEGDERDGVALVMAND